jgi:ATP-dependent RNA helicase DeaD
MPFPELPPALGRALEERGYAEPTPVQALVLDGPSHRDLLVSARTGSGKTVAFGLAAARMLLGESGAFARPGPPVALVVAPTRELALQVQRELAWLFAPANGRVASCVGGMDPRREARVLDGGVHIVVGTPGRLCDHIERGNLDLSAVGVVVLDEADEMLDMGFRDELERILDATPSTRRTLLFSATLPKGIEELAARYQKDAVRIAASAPGERHADIAYKAVLVAAREREHAVVNLLRWFDPPSAIVFVNTRDGVNHLAASLHERGFGAVALSGELTQAERTRALQALRDGRARVLVATDVAARGLDLPDLACVIHADLPHDPQVMQHRSGRTGRAGKKGIALLLVPPSRRRAAERLVHGGSVTPEWIAVPTADAIIARDQERLAAEIVGLIEEPAEDDLTVARSVLEGRGAEAVAAALVKLLRGRLPAPEDLPETAWIQRKETEAMDRSQRRPARPDPRVPMAPPDRRGPRARVEEQDPRDERPRPPREESTPRRPTREPNRWPGDADGEFGGGPRDEGGWDEPRPRRGGSIWFRVNVGRAQNADPRWLIPVICRRGQVDKSDIGAIRIFERDTRFEVREELAAHFDHNARRPDRKDPNIKFWPIG